MTRSAFYRESSVYDAVLPDSKKYLQGKELSFNNIVDLNSAYHLAKEFETTCAIIVKHNNPCVLGAWDPEGYANLRSKTTTRIAYGEREWTLEQFERVLATGTVDVVGVDPGRAEGITGFKKVTERCEFYRRQANAHAWSSAIVSAASLAISFNSPACKLFEFKPLRNPMQHDLVTKPFEHNDGWMYPPTGPGLGIEVIEEVVEGYRSEKVLGG